MIGRTNAVIGKSQSKWPSADDVQVTYTGNMADPREITDAAGNKYVLYELKTSGVLTVDKPVPVDVCVVMGGAHGDKTTGNQWGSWGNIGGYGGSMINALAILTGSMDCVVGAAGGGNSSIEFQEYSIRANVVGTGPGGSSGGNQPSGDGKEKYVFGDNSVYDYPICAGGGGGSSLSNVLSQEVYRITSVVPNGGTNGGNGVGTKTIDYSTNDYPSARFPYLPWATPKGEGGYNGGGNGAYYTAETQSSADVVNATDAFTYGSGGGAAILVDYDGRGNYRALGNNGKGYQGVIFIRIQK